MRLIKKIEINYLRSLYRAKLDNVGDLNVVFGRNDSGKSNVLRALNLFFNDEIEPDQWFDFDLDMSDLRKQEAREAKGRQFLWIKITFTVPSNYRGALGNEIAIKRQWNRDSEVNTWFFPTPATAGQQARATRFLNDIGFTYIPAIKDLEVYADLIERVYESASEAETLQSATTEYISAIGAHTETLSSQLSLLFDAETVLAPPTEMSRLFRSMDFAHGDEKHSLLRQKGDGIKARHLPELVRFINEHERRKRLHLWGFEEPENSLDLASAEAEASRFANFSSRSDTQVFVTSHSPAFYLAESDEDARVSRYFVTKQESSSDGLSPREPVVKISDLRDAEDKMQRAGLMQLPYVIKQLSEQRELLKAAETEVGRLRVELARLQKPTVFVEGKHDQPVFEKAVCRAGYEEEVEVRQLRGTPHTPRAFLGSMLGYEEWNANCPTIILLDNDRSGRRVYREFIGKAPGETPERYANNVFMWVLPVSEEFSEFAGQYGITKENRHFTAEFLFSCEKGAALCAELAAAADGRYLDELRRIHGDYWEKLGQDACIRLINAEFGSTDWFLSRGVPNGLKSRFFEGAEERGFETEMFDSVVERALRCIV